ncbi:MAG: response regulator [Bosea sp. (in: a-proteobacteria)]
MSDQLPNATNRPVRILVADDSRTIRMALSGMLAACGSFELIQAENGHETLAALRTGACDVAFIDVQMPDLSGPEALAWAQQEGHRPFLIMMSGLVMPQLLEIASKLGAYEFLKKPFAPEDIAAIMATLARVCSVSRALLVEDSHVTRQIIGKMLAATRFNLAVDTVEDGPHALKAQKLEPYDVAIIDVNLNGTSGFEVACQLQTHDVRTKAIMMSADGSSALAGAAQQFGAISFLRKPFFPRDLDLALHKAFGLRVPDLLANSSEPRARLAS